MKSFDASKLKPVSKSGLLTAFLLSNFSRPSILGQYVKFIDQLSTFPPVKNFDPVRFMENEVYE